MLLSVRPATQWSSRHRRGQDRAHGCATQTQRHSGADKTLLFVPARAGGMVPRGRFAGARPWVSSGQRPRGLLPSSTSWRPKVSRVDARLVKCRHEEHDRHLRIWRSVPWCESNAYWFASSGPTGRCRRASLRLRNAASPRPIALAIPACTAEAGSGTVRLICSTTRERRS